MAFGCGTTVEPGGDVIKNYSDFQFQDFQEKLLYLHNKERTSRGYEKLIIDKNLCEYAQKHAEYMVSKNSLTHSSMSKLMSVDKDTSVVGENIAWGQETEESVVSSWMWSPGHRWNILGSSYRRVGFGMKLDKDSRKYWCVVFSN
jgi:uncharacterized protein YkwD